MRLSLLTICVAVTLSWALPATAGWHEFWQSVERDFHRNNCWPEPFNHWDRQDMVRPMQAMVAKGWQERTTLSSWHFHAGTNQLNHFGQKKLYWILTQADPRYRTIFVVRSEEEAATTTRVDSVQQYVARTIPSGPLPAVNMTYNEPFGRSGHYIDTIEQRVIATIPDPRLPEFTDESE